MANTKIPSELIADSAITAAKLADGTITTADIADSNVTTAKIADSNVTTAKIGDAQVTTAKIVDANVTTAKIADSNVTTAKILDNNITSAKLASALTLGGNTTFSGNIIKDSGDLTLDVPGTISIDADGADIMFKDGGTEFGRVYNSSSDFAIYSAVQDKDIKLQGNDGGSTVTALTLDMSDAGTAIFNHDVKMVSDDSQLIFGADSDLKIYHSSSVSYIKTSTDLPLKFFDAGGASMVDLIPNGAVSLYHNGSAKLATTSTGINVTSDDSSFTNPGDSDMKHAFQSNSSSDHILHRLIASDGADGKFIIAYGPNHPSTPNHMALKNTHASGGLAFYTGAASTNWLHITADGKIGINNASPAHRLHIQGDTNDLARARVTNTSTGQASLDLSNTEGYFRTLTDGGEYRIYDQTDGAYRMRIDTSGNVAIGSHSPSALLHVKSSGNGEIEVERDSGALINLQAQASLGVIGTDSNHDLGLKTNGSVRLRIDTDGDVGIGVVPAGNSRLTIGGTATSYSSVLKFDNNTSGGAEFFMLASDDTWSAGANKFLMGHGAPSSAATQLVIDADGNVGINTTTPTSYGNSQTTLTIQDTTGPAICWSDTGQTRDWFAVAQGSGLYFNYADGGGGGGASNVSDVLVLDNSGDVGIGTDDPQGKFSVEADTTSNKLVGLFGSTTANRGIGFGQTVTGTGGTGAIFGTDGDGSNLDQTIFMNPDGGAIVMGAVPISASPAHVTIDGRGDADTFRLSFDYGHPTMTSRGANLDFRLGNASGSATKITTNYWPGGGGDIDISSYNVTNQLYLDTGGYIGIRNGSPSAVLDIIGSGYEDIRLGSNRTDNTNKTAGITSYMYTNNSVSIFQGFFQNGNNAVYYGSADGAHRGIQSHYWYVNTNYNATSGHTLAMSMNSSGHILQQKQPRFHVYGSASTVSHNTNPIIFNNTYVNNGSHYSTSTGKFTAPIGGTYIFFWSSIGGSPNDTYRYHLMKNNAVIGDIHLRADTTATGTEYATNGSRVQMITLSTGDTIHIRFQADSSNSSYSAADYLNFGGYLLG